MKKGIHPTYQNCKVYHNGEVVMEVGGTSPELHVEDAAGRVEKFQRKFQGDYFKKKKK